VGFNMSWIFVDQIDLNDLYAALDVKSTGQAADPYDLGTKRVPLGGLRPKDGWCAIFGRYSFVLDITIGTDPPRLARACRPNQGQSAAWSLNTQTFSAMRAPEQESGHQHGVRHPHEE